MGLTIPTSTGPFGRHRAGARNVTGHARGRLTGLDVELRLLLVDDLDGQVGPRGDRPPQHERRASSCIERTPSAGRKCTVVPVVSWSGIDSSPVTGMPCSYRCVQAPLRRRLVCTSQGLSAATTDTPRRGRPSGSSWASGRSKNRRSLVAMMGFLTGWSRASRRVSVPLPLSATDNESSACRVTRHCLWSRSTRPRRPRRRAPRGSGAWCRRQQRPPGPGAPARGVRRPPSWPSHGCCSARGEMTCSSRPGPGGQHPHSDRREVDLGGAGHGAGATRRVRLAPVRVRVGDRLLRGRPGSRTRACPRWCARRRRAWCRSRGPRHRAASSGCTRRSARR